MSKKDMMCPNTGRKSVTILGGVSPNRRYFRGGDAAIGCGECGEGVGVMVGVEWGRGDVGEEGVVMWGIGLRVVPAFDAEKILNQKPGMAGTDYQE